MFVHTFDFSALYTTIPREKNRRLVKRNHFTLKMVSNVTSVSLEARNNLFCQTSNKRNKVVLKTWSHQYFKLVLDNIFVLYGWLIFQEIPGISMGTNCAPLLFDLFFYLYETEIIQKTHQRQDNACFVLHWVTLFMWKWLP